VILKVEICGKPARALLDSGAQGNFISHTFVEENRIPWQLKDEPYRLHTVDGTPVSHGNGRVTMETRPGMMQIDEHRETIRMDITDTARHDIILGIPWLREHNPQVDWKSNKVRIQPESGPKGTPRQDKPERKLEINMISSRGIQRAHRKKQAVGQFWYRPTDLDDRQLAEAARAPDVPRAYQEFKEIFKEKVQNALPRHQPSDHQIPLEPGGQPKFGPLYSLSQEELETLREYLDKNLKRGFIRPSESPAGYPVMFVPKKDGKMRLCVDYR